MASKKELAMELHNKGYNCCQAVACAFCKEVGVEEATMFKAGEGFGLGMGGSDCTCGALSGAIMVAGFKNSTANLDGDKSKGATYQLSKKMVETFAQKNSSVLCKDLKGLQTGKVLRTCPGCIEDGVALVESILGL